MQKQQIEEMVDSFKKTKEEFTNKMKYTFGLFFKEFFNDNPKIKEVKWTQYTPYFNDGDTCTFRTHFYDVLQIDEMENITAEEQKQFEKVEKELEKLLYSIPKEIYLDMFGDHSEVTATADGFDVSDCDHD